MDFRSQLSAFANKSSNSSSNSANQGGSTQRSPSGNRGNNNSNSNHDYYGRGGGGGSSGSVGGAGYDRRRPRPRGGWNDHRDGRDRYGPPASKRGRHTSPEQDWLAELRSFGYRIPRNPTEDHPKGKAIHLCLLAITIDDLPYEHIWRDWSTNTITTTSQGQPVWISLVCHAKFPQRVQSEWLKQRLLVYPPKVGRGNSFLDPEFLTRKPNWGSVDITRAMLDLLQDGMKIGKCSQTDVRFSANRYLIKRPPLSPNAVEDEPIPPVDQFLYLSETCLPVTTAQVVFDTLQDTTVSWVNARNRKDPGTPKNKYESDQFAGIHRRIPGQYRWKADQWISLCRHHASLVLGIDRPHIPPKHQLWQSFRDINASDEMYFPTCLALLGLLRNDAVSSQIKDDNKLRKEGNPPKVDDKNPQSLPQPTTTAAAAATNATTPLPPVILKRPITYTDWSEGMRNPATFSKGFADFRRVAKEARSKGCLLARKFAPFIPVPGVAPEEQKITGHITVEEWREVVEMLSHSEMQQQQLQQVLEPSQNKVDMDPQNKEEQETFLAHDEEDVDEGQEEGEKEEDQEEGDVQEEEEEEEEEEQNDEEDDDGENQLE